MVIYHAMKPGDLILLDGSCPFWTGVEFVKESSVVEGFNGHHTILTEPTTVLVLRACKGKTMLAGEAIMVLTSDMWICWTWSNYTMGRSLMLTKCDGHLIRGDK